MVSPDWSVQARPNSSAQQAPSPFLTLHEWQALGVIDVRHTGGQAGRVLARDLAGTICRYPVGMPKEAAPELGGERIDLRFIRFYFWMSMLY
jgi:hypothetical protein